MFGTSDMRYRDNWSSNTCRVFMRVKIAVNSKTLELFKRSLKDHLPRMLWKRLNHEELVRTDLKVSN